MTNTSLTRRELARLAAGMAGALLPAPASAQTAESTPMTSSPPPNTPDEGAALARAVPLSAGYALSEAQTREVALALKGYPGAFGKARAFALPDDVGPAWVSTPPPPASTGRKDTKKGTKGQSK